MEEKSIKLPRFKNTQYAMLGLIILMAYFYINDIILPKTMSALIGVFGVLVFLQQHEYEGYITLEEAIKIAQNRIPDFQKERIIKDGTYKITDAGLQYMTLKTEQTGPFRYLIGCRVRGFRNYQNYLLAISPTGRFLSKEERNQGWRLQDEPLLMKVSSPEAKIEFIKKEGATEPKVGEFQ